MKSLTKYLGMIMDSAYYVNLKLSKGVGILCILWHPVTKQIMQSLYFTFVQPYVDYGLINWGGANRSTFEPVRKTIKNIIPINYLQI